MPIFLSNHAACNAMFWRETLHRKIQKNVPFFESFFLAKRSINPKSSVTTTRNESKTTTADTTTITSPDVEKTDVPEEEHHKKVKMKRQLGLINAISLIVGVVVGAGIFVSPRGVIQECGSVAVALIIWTLCGMVCGLGALCYAELGTTIPVAGGDYSYIFHVFGHIPSFMLLWANILIMQPVSNAISALTFSNYILAASNPDCPPSQDAVRLLSGSVIFLLTAINCYSVKYSAKIQNWFALAKVLALVLIIATGTLIIIDGKESEWLRFPKSFEGTHFHIRPILMSFYSGMFSFNGWQLINYVVEEMINPSRNLPRAILISLPTITVVFLLTNIAYFASLSPAEVIASNAVAVTFGNKNFGKFSWIMPISVSMCTFSGLNGLIFTSSRMWFAGARNGHLPESLSLLNVKYLTPFPVLVVLGVLSCAYLLTTEVYILINYCIFIQYGSVLASLTALIYLRLTKPEMPRPIKIPLILPCIFYVFCIWIVFFPFYAIPTQSCIGLGIALSAIPIYFLTVNWKNKPIRYQKLIEWFTITFQKLFYAVPQED